MAFLTQLCFVHHLVSIGVILGKTYSDNMFSDEPFYKQIIPTFTVRKKKSTLIGTHTYLPTAKKGIKQAITAADFTVHALQCHGIASSLVCELKSTKHFGVKFWCVKQHSGPETLSRLSRNCPITRN